MADVVGAGQLVYGSDRPVVDAVAPPARPGLGHALLPRTRAACCTPTEGRRSRERALEDSSGPGRDLDRDELLAVATADREPRRSSGPRTSRHDPTQRTYEQLLRDEHLDVWLLCWSQDHDTGFHDHDLSAGAVAVDRRAAVREERLALGRGASTRRSPARRPPGRRSRFGASDIHRVLHAGGEPAVTIHAYSPPLVRMGSYMVEPDGELRRHAISYEEELRPLDAAAR